MTDEELSRLNKRLDALELKLDQILNESKKWSLVSRCGSFFKGCVTLFLVVIVAHVFVIGGIGAYTLMKGTDSKSETESDPKPARLNGVSEPTKDTEQILQDLLIKNRESIRQRDDIRIKGKKAEEEFNASLQRYIDTMRALKEEKRK